MRTGKDGGRARREHENKRRPGSRKNGGSGTKPGSSFGVFSRFPFFGSKGAYLHTDSSPVFPDDASGKSDLRTATPEEPEEKDTEKGDESAVSLPRSRHSLSTRLFITVMASVLIWGSIFVTSLVGRDLADTMRKKLEISHVSLISLDRLVHTDAPENLEKILLYHAEAEQIVVQFKNWRTVLLANKVLPRFDYSFDIKEMGHGWSLLLQALPAVFADPGKLVRIRGAAPRSLEANVEVIFRTGQLRRIVVRSASGVITQTLVLLLVIAVVTFAILHRVMVHPMRVLVGSIINFRVRPEDMSRDDEITRHRDDEIGLAMQEFHHMRSDLRDALWRRTRLAALGVALAKVIHDLRNILAIIQLNVEAMANTTGKQEDSHEFMIIQRGVAKALNRAVRLCKNTLHYAYDRQRKLQFAPLQIRELVDEAFTAITNPASVEANDATVKLCNELPGKMVLSGDSDELHRVFLNLARNALEAKAKHVTVKSVQQAAPRFVRIIVHDDGRGLPVMARKNLFKPFAGSAKAGGTGLGLPVAQQIMRAHGGDLLLEDSSSKGTSFCLCFPARLLVGALSDKASFVQGKRKNAA